MRDAYIPAARVKRAVRTWRTRHSLSYAAIAVHAKVSVSTAQRWESGKADLSATMIWRLERRNRGLVALLFPQTMHRRKLRRRGRRPSVAG